MTTEKLSSRQMDLLRVIHKFRSFGGANCKDILAQVDANPGLNIPSDLDEISSACNVLKSKKGLLTESEKKKSGKPAFFLTNDALILIGALKVPSVPEDQDRPARYRDEKKPQAEAECSYKEVTVGEYVMNVLGDSTKEPAAIVETVAPPTNPNRNSKEADNQLTREYLRIVLDFADNGGATAEDVLGYVKNHSGFNVPHDLDKICKRLSDLKQKRGFLLDAPKKNNRKSVVLSPLGQDFLNGIDPPKTEKKDDVMKKQIEAVPTTQSIDDLLEGIKSAIMNKATKVPEKAKKLGALDRLIGSKVICAELREDLVCVRSFIASLEEA